MSFWHLKKRCLGFLHKKVIEAVGARLGGRGSRN